MVATDNPLRHGFLGSKTDMSKVMSDDDANLFNKLARKKSTNPMENSEDLMILYTSINEDMDFLITNNIHEFQILLQAIKIPYQQN
jgi:hypothetical protein